MRWSLGHVASGLAGGLIAVVVMAAIPAVAGNGDPVQIGQKNTGVRVTKLTSRGGLLLKVGKPGNPALTIEVADASTPPMAINSKGRVRNLNADLLDGKHASAFAGSDEGLMGGYYEVASGQSMTIFSEGPFRLDAECIYSPGGGPPPPSRTLRLELTAEGGEGMVDYHSGGGTPYPAEWMYDGRVLGWNVTTAYSVDVGEIYLLAMGTDGTLLRLEGVAWTDYYDGVCKAAIQFVPFPEPVLGPPPAP